MMLLLLLLIISMSGNSLRYVKRAEMSNKFLESINPEDVIVTRTVKSIIQSFFSGCSLTLSLDHPGVSKPLEQLMIWNHKSRYPMMVSTMRNFPYNKDYPWVWKPSQLMSFRTQPPELRSHTWPGGTCAFNMILVLNTSNLPQTIMYAASVFKMRNLYDPFFIHVQELNSQNSLLHEPVRGIRLKLMSQFVSRKLEFYNVCYCCNHGEDTLNKVDQMSSMFPDPPRNLNGRRRVVGFIEDVDMKGAKIRHDNDEYISSTEETMLMIQEIFNCVLTVTKPEFTTSDLNPNGSLAGFTSSVFRNEITSAGVIFYTDVAERALMLGHPMYYLYGGFATRIPRSEIKWYLIFMPYSPGMWLALVASLLLTATTLSVLDRHRIVFGLINTHFKLLLRVLLEQTSYFSRDTPTLMLHAHFLAFSIVVICLYKTKLVSLITFPPPEDIPTTGLQLIESEMTWGTTGLLVIGLTVAVQNLNNPVYRHVLDNVVLTPTLRDCVNRTQTEDFACIAPDIMYHRERDYFLDKNGNPKTIFWTDRSVNAYTGPAYGRDDVHFVTMNKVLKGLAEGDIVNHIILAVNHRNFVRNYFQILRGNVETLFEEKESMLDVKKLANIFHMWSVGMGLSCIGFVYEKFRWRIVKRSWDWGFLL